MLVRQWPIVWAGNLAVHAVCAFLLWPYFSHPVIGLWFASNLLLFGYRLKMWSRFEDSIRKGPETLRRWARNYVLSAIVGGLIWGSASWLFFESSDSETTLLLLLVLTSLSIGALPALSSYSPAFIAFSTAISVPVALRMLGLDGEFASAIALLTMILLALNIFYSRRLDRTISESITVDLDNRALLNDVSTARNMAESANRAKSDFLASVSHDLRQPLHAMGLFLSSLQRQLDKPKQQQTFTHIETAHDSLCRMFDALLEISRLDSGAIKPVRTHFRLQTLLDELDNNFSPLARQKNLRLDLRPCPAIVHSDQVLLFGILSNLLSNALKYTEQGEVRIDCREQDGQIVVAVRDTGCGIPATAQERIFAPYQQLDNPERDATRGLGLGLAMVKKSCRLLDIALTLQSSTGRGSTFTLTLPAGDASQLTSEPLSPPDPGLQGLHILVIDDNTSILAGTRELLSDWGCQVSCSESAQQALAVISHQSRPVDLLICDYRLREQQTGIDAIRKIRSHVDPALPTLLMTGDTNPALHQALKEQGYYVLRKPIQAARLRSAIATLTRRPGNAYCNR